MIHQKPRFAIGIDPGVKTGVAVWDRMKKALVQVKTATIIEAMEVVLDLRKIATVEVLYEDARLRAWFGTKGAESLQGAGSIKRDSSIWEEFCRHHGIAFQGIKPAKGATKWDAAYFRRATGWTGRTSEHGRDAALLVVNS